MICDRLVIGIRDCSLSERLQMDPDLTLEKAKQIVRQREAVQKQQTLFNHKERLAETMVNYVNTDRRSSSHRPKAARIVPGVERAHTRVAPVLQKKPSAINARIKVTTEPNDLGDITTQFIALFSGLGTLNGEFQICLKPDATPFTLHTPRNIPLPLRKKVKEELSCMESLGVISKVDVPAPWCAGMVVVPKKDGTVRICVDLKPLNTAVLREAHPLPKVDETLAQLSGAMVFSKLDANSGFGKFP